MSHTDHNNNTVDLGAHYDGWGYEGNYAPSTWKHKFPLADGKHQSPIDIHTESAEHAPHLTQHPLNFFYDTSCFTHIVNTGSSFKVSGSETAVSKVVGGPVCEEHKFLQFHAHWGKDETVGSEHLVDGKSYAAELHFVNWNSTRYPSPNEAVQSSNHDGLIVLGVFLDIGEHNAEFDKIVNALSHIKLKGQEADLKESIDYSKLFPANTTDYWTYEGSLTTPPCSECVQWVVYKNPIHISRQQLQTLHDLYICKESSDCCDALRMSQNFRPICDLNSRPVKKSFK